MTVLIAVFIAYLAVVGTTIFHYESLKAVGRLSRLHHHPHLIVPTVLSLVIAAHVVEVLLYACIYEIALGPLHLGSITGVKLTPLTLVYFAAETYSSLGNGDILPHGAIRLITSIGSLNGILLLAWSGSFLFTVTGQVDQRSARDQG
ncbi:two pore domain potassium channel family protein [Sphingomonas sp. ID1715]|uniref:ion channel n=1 Tax=Sphingomonas sp. ID1715 TaxID=1656898 RepID=UPI0014888AFC|nr:ion channel [Sphingomonas sp. ID1715]NNM77745.1 two pore domain potassium channel family protein [Sphingomonas sp. ID1715]